MPGTFTKTLGGKTYRFHPIRMDETWFNDGEDNGSAPASGTSQLEFAEAEIGKDNQFAEYDAVLIGQPSDDSRKPGRTVEWHVEDDNQNGADSVPKGMEFRAIGRPRSARDGSEIVSFGPHRKLNETTPSEQVGVGLQPGYVSNGKVLALHARDPGGSEGVSLGAGGTSIEIHGYGGYQVS